MNCDALIAQLRGLLGDRVSTGDSVRDIHSRGESHHHGVLPDAVVFPTSTEEVQTVVTACAAAGCPMTPYGAGSSLEGHVIPLQGGVTIDLSRMNRIVRLSVEDLDVTVEAGVTRKQLEKHLLTSGLWFPLDPGADATIGGMAATRASGTTAVRYGTMKDAVLGLTVVTADGKVVKTGTRARKSSAGYDLTRLFVGAEGTLGIITDVTLRLYGRPEAVAAATCWFDSIDDAVNAVIMIVQLGIPVARIELLDEAQIDAVNKHSKMSLPVAPTLFFEFHGLSDAAIEENAQATGEIVAEHGGHDYVRAATPEERAKLWHARHEAYYASLALRPGSRAWTTDVCVPISRLADCIHQTKADLADSPLIGPIVGHVGDGNFHMIMPVNPESPEEMAAAEHLVDRLVARALAMGGTCTGEHGVGQGKAKYLKAELGDGLAVMRAIKAALDPLDIMNPGKIFPA